MQEEKEIDDTFASVSFASIAGAASTSAAATAANGFAKGPVASTAIDMFAWDWVMVGTSSSKKRLVVDGAFHCSLHHCQIVVNGGKAVCHFN
jgi:hypothetical protein